VLGEEPGVRGGEERTLCIAETKLKVPRNKSHQTWKQFTLSEENKSNFGKNSLKDRNNDKVGNAAQLLLCYILCYILLWNYNYNGIALPCLLCLGWPLLNLPGLKRTFHVPSVWMSSAAQSPHHVDTTSAEPALLSSGMKTSSANVLFATSFSMQDLICVSIYSY
jgi:hypothetical protein